MRIHVPGPRPRDEGEYEVRVNPGDAWHQPFATIALSANSDTEICLDDLDDARRLVNVAVKALHRLEVTVKGERHPYQDDANRCGECGQGEYSDIHAPVIIDSERTCPEVNPDSGAWCHRDGDHGVHEDTDGETWRTDGPFVADEDSPCMKVGCGHGYDDHSLDLERGDRLYCQRCECRRFECIPHGPTAVAEPSGVTA